MLLPFLNLFKLAYLLSIKYCKTSISLYSIASFKVLFQLRSLAPMPLSPQLRLSYFIFNSSIRST